MVNIVATFGDILSELRGDKGLKQKDLAVLLGVAPNTVSSYENNHYLPDIHIIIKIAEIFDVSVDYLLGLIRSDANMKYIDKEYCRQDNQLILTGDVFKRIVKLQPNVRNLLIEAITFLEEKGNRQNKK